MLEDIQSKYTNPESPEVIAQQEIERKKKALEWLFFEVLGMDTLDLHMPEDIKRLRDGSEIIDSWLKHDGSMRDIPNFYLSLMKYIGSDFMQNTEIQQIISEIKEKVRAKPELLDLIHRKINPEEFLNSYDNNPQRYMSFFDGLQAAAPAILAHQFYPERLKYLAEGIIEVKSLSIDEIYAIIASFLRRNIEFGISQGYSEAGGAEAADSLGNYIKLLEKFESVN